MTITGMQMLDDWVQPGNVGDDGGSSSVPNGKFVMLPGSPARFVAAGAYPYNNGYFYGDVSGDYALMTYFEYAFHLTFPTQADIDACQAFEFELQQNIGSSIYNMAYQFDLKGTKLIRTFDYNKNAWVPTTIPVPSLTPGEAVAISAKFLRQNGSLTHLSIDINGVENVVNITRPSTPKVESDYVHVSVQLDSASPAVPYIVEIDNIGLLMLPSAA